MKLRVMDFLVCPACCSELSLQSEQREIIEYPQVEYERALPYMQHQVAAGRAKSVEALWQLFCTNVTRGLLSCEKCSTVFAIEGGIPRMLPPALRTLAASMGRGNPLEDQRIGFFDDSLPPVDPTSPLFQEIQLANQSNYGYEWQAFCHEYREWDSIYKKSYVSEDDAFFKNKLGLDGGCGMARYSLPPVNRGAEVVGLDLSNAIEAAYRKSLKVATFHAVQGDIFNLPFRSGTFDFVQSLGVIHITPNPEAALLSLKRVVQQEGKMFIYVYQSFEEHNLLKHYMLKLVNPLRRLTVKMPSNILYYFLYLLVPVVLLGCYLPSWLLWHVPFLKALSSKFPYSYEQYRGRRLRDFHMNLFDRFGNPVERRYNRNQMDRWMSSAGFKRYAMQAQDGWNVTAIV